MNVIARLEFELAYYDSAVHRFNHYTTRTPPDMTGLRRWYTGNCARNLNLTILTHGICTTRNLSWRMRCLKCSGISRYKTDHLISSRLLDLKVNYRRVTFAILADYRVKRKEKKREINIWTMLENKKIWIMNVMVIPIVNGAFGILKVSVKGLEDMEIRGQEETIQITALLRYARTL